MTIRGARSGVWAKLYRDRALNSFVLLFSVVVLTMLLSGCAINRATADLTPGTNLQSLKTFYVVKFQPDNRGIESIIRDRLVAMGYEAYTGTAPKPTRKVDAVVTYRDKWMWDITMYMLELTITLRNPDTEFPLAVGNSYHTSLTRKSPTEMVEEVLGNIFSAPKKPKTTSS